MKVAEERMVEMKTELQFVWNRSVIGAERCHFAKAILAPEVLSLELHETSTIKLFVATFNQVSTHHL